MHGLVKGLPKTPYPKIWVLFLTAFSLVAKSTLFRTALVSINGHKKEGSNLSLLSIYKC